VPAITLLCLVHCGIALTGFVFGGGRGGDNTGIHNTAFTQNKTLALQVFIDFTKELFAELVSLEEVPKIKNADFIGQAITQAQTYKASHRLNLIQRVFQRRITQILKKVAGNEYGE